MTGGAEPPGLVTVNQSVRHRVCRFMGAPTPVFSARSPLRTEPIFNVVVAVSGPVMEKVLKSSLSWQMLLLQGQIMREHSPISEPVDTK